MWKKKNVFLADVVANDLSQFSARFRSSEPTVLVVHFNVLPWSLLVKCAPINEALCATASWTVNVQRAIGGWTCRQDVRNKGTFLQFQQELHEAGVTLEHAPRSLLTMFSWGQLPGKQWMRRFGKHEPPLGHLRVSGIVVPNEAVSRALEYFDEELCQYREHAFVSALEGVEFSEKGRTIVDRTLFQATCSYDHSMIFGHVSRYTYDSPARRQETIERLHSEMQHGVGLLESGEQWEPELFYSDRANPQCFFQVVDPEKVQAPLVHDVELETFALRARLVHLLGWPQFYLNGSVQNALDLLNSYYAHLFPIEGAIYNIPSELMAYVRNVEKKYPIVTAPFELT